MNAASQPSARPMFVCSGGSGQEDGSRCHICGRNHIRAVYGEDRREVAPAAAKERDLREQHYPEQVRRGEISAEEANADYVRWCAIAMWLESRSMEWMIWDLVWQDLVDAAKKALQWREDACRAKPENAALAARRDRVARIALLLQRHGDDMADLNARLRDDVERRRKEREQAA